jgi:DNA-binding transcriptional LysR family regulator
LKRGTSAFDELQQGIRDIEFLADPESGEVKIGCPVGVGNTLMLQLIGPFMQKYPRVALNVDAVTNPQAFVGLFDRTYDLYITLQPLPERRVPDGLRVEMLFSDPLVVAAGNRHRLASRRKVEFAQLAEDPWILPRTDSWNYICVLDAFQARGLAPPKVALWSNIVPLRNQLIATGRFVTALAKSNVRWHGMKVLPVELPAHDWPLVVATLKNRTLSPVVQLFIEFVRDFTKPMRKA